MTGQLEALTNKLAKGLAAAMTADKVDPSQFGFVLIVTSVEDAAYASTGAPANTLVCLENIANKLRADMGLPPIPVPE